MVAAETAARRAHLTPVGAVADERGKLQREVRVEGVLAIEAISRRSSLVVPGILVDRIDADHLQFAAVDLGREGADHAAVLILTESAARCREDHDRKAGVTECQQLHIAVQRWAIPLHVIATHQGRNLSYRTLDS